MNKLKLLSFYISTLFSFQAISQQKGVIQAMVFHECVDYGIRFKVTPMTPQADDDFLVKIEDKSIPTNVVDFRRLDKYNVQFHNVFNSTQAHLTFTIQRKGYEDFVYSTWSSTCSHDNLPLTCPENNRTLSIDNPYPDLRDTIKITWNSDYMYDGQTISWYNENMILIERSNQQKSYKGWTTNYPIKIHAQPSHYMPSNICHGWTEIILNKQKDLVFPVDTSNVIDDYTTFLPLDTLTNSTSFHNYNQVTFPANHLSRCASSVKFSDSTWIDLQKHISPKFSISMWLKPDSNAINDVLGATLFSKLKALTSTDGFSIGLDAQLNLQAVCRQKNISGAYDGNIKFQTKLPKNQWSHLVVTYDGLDLKIYLNGIFSDRKRVGIGQDTSASLRIANHTIGSHPYKGCMDELKIYDKYLNDIEIQHLFNVENTPQDEVKKVTNLAPMTSYVNSDIIHNNAQQNTNTTNITQNIALKSIELLPGFQTNAGSSFMASIKTCPQ